MKELLRLKGLWAGALAFADGRREHTITRYQLGKDGRLLSSGRAMGFDGHTLILSGSLTDSPDGVVTFRDGQGDHAMTGTVTLGKGTLNFEYGPKGQEKLIYEELAFQENGDATGTAFMGKGGAEVLKFRFRKLTPAVPRLALGGKDPLTVIAGKPLPGSDRHTATYGQWSYQFSSAANRAAFLKNPEASAVQFDGACMNMGPLTGRGNPENYTVHDGKLYFFASPGCKSTFLKNPPAFLDAADAPVKGTESAKELLNKAAAAHGGKALDAIQSLNWYESKNFKQDGIDRPYLSGWAYHVGGYMADFQSWEFDLWKNVISPKKSDWWSGKVTSPNGLHESEAAFLARQFARHPIVLLRHRRDKGLQATVMPPGSIRGQHNKTVVRVSFRGATTDLVLDPFSHKVLGAKFKHRLARGNTPVERTYLWQDVDGATVPMGWTTYSDTSEQTQTFVMVGINKLQTAFFAHPLR